MVNPSKYSTVGQGMSPIKSRRRIDRSLSDTLSEQTALLLLDRVFAADRRAAIIRQRQEPDQRPFRRQRSANHAVLNHDLLTLPGTLLPRTRRVGCVMQSGH